MDWKELVELLNRARKQARRKWDVKQNSKWELAEKCCSINLRMHRSLFFYNQSSSWQFSQQRAKAFIYFAEKRQRAVGVVRSCVIFLCGLTSSWLSWQLSSPGSRLLTTIPKQTNSDILPSIALGSGFCGVYLLLGPKWNFWACWQLVKALDREF